MNISETTTIASPIKETLNHQPLTPDRKSSEKEMQNQLPTRSRTRNGNVTTNIDTMIASANAPKSRTKKNNTNNNGIATDNDNNINISLADEAASTNTNGNEYGINFSMGSDITSKPNNNDNNNNNNNNKSQESPSHSFLSSSSSVSPPQTQSQSQSQSQSSTPIQSQSQSQSQEIYETQSQPLTTTTTTTTSTSNKKRRSASTSSINTDNNSKSTTSSKSSKRPPKGKKDKKKDTEEEDDDDEMGSTRSSGSTKSKRSRLSGSEEKTSNRFDNSLVQLTKKFLDLIEKSPNGVLDLKVASEKLEISKRRIYDVTCVLEGVGLIEKCSKNQVLWKGVDVNTTPSTQPIDPKCTDNYKKELKRLIEKESNLDNLIKKANKNIHNILYEPKSSKYMFVTHDDLRGIEKFKGETVIAVRAPSGTRFQIPDPDEGMEPGTRRYQILLDNETGTPIDVFLLNQTPVQSDTPPQQSTPQHLQLQQLQQTTAQQDQLNSSDSKSFSDEYSYATNAISNALVSINNQHIQQQQQPTQHTFNNIDQNHLNVSNILSPNKQVAQGTFLSTQNASYWEPNSILPSYSPFEIVNGNNNNNNNQHNDNRNPNMLYVDQSSEFNYFDSMIESEGISELYTDDSFLTQSFDDFGNQSIDH
ncbi:hypothetical protein DICPUDRAFT_98517 [Dictyostelium purpureum]|uniref:E2F/DP family winged-helix DNA-binding domain-containing protein n=1 Tax=Dictyostelium purpureum TaxID=5786 RepID=F0ZR40_DICPU|nr:uncharacterized protein DICPUDRAFT_98517 [Dictyostelium purpureum]EGC33569.1 hypothetical protein DICPUDRAFT_98517 [Dictyostelium purpureum]|eukprot:XP_003289884.1 hypothetical protein DICPUDRAFT_98517 [Dictyostelium purpureum]